MKNLETSQGALKRAERWYQSAIRAFEDERWDDVMYSCQMSVEQALKAILILYGVEYPKIHDISSIYINIKTKDLPRWFSSKMEFHASILEELNEKRGPSAYGYIEGMIKDDFKEDAFYFKDPVNEIINDCKKLIEDFSKKQKSVSYEEDNSKI